MALHFTVTHHEMKIPSGQFCCVVSLCAFFVLKFFQEQRPYFFSGLHPNGRLFACGHTGEFSSSLATMGGMKRESTVENSAPRGENTCRIFMELNMLTLALAWNNSYWTRFFSWHAHFPVSCSYLVSFALQVFIKPLKFRLYVRGSLVWQSLRKNCIQNKTGRFKRQTPKCLVLVQKGIIRHKG